MTAVNIHVKSTSLSSMFDTSGAQGDNTYFPPTCTGTAVGKTPSISPILARAESSTCSVLPSSTAPRFVIALAKAW
ncbi:hypothetical protein BDV32DRAFT_115761 [Aspergillus pseudonomiae]|nr:hypothetical protein BDV32DRAFT_115761 [Aspergillus pseudonomiae]